MLYRSLIAASISACLMATIVIAGGTPDNVKYPKGYQDSFTNYVTMNRSGKELVAIMYANDVAMNSYKEGKPAGNGAIVIMEVYKPKKDGDGNAIIGEDGIFVTDKLAAVAVMERQSWGNRVSDKDQIGDWAFGFYNEDGSTKANKLNCVECHTPLNDTDFLFTYDDATSYAKDHSN